MLSKLPDLQRQPAADLVLIDWVVKPPRACPTHVDVDRSAGNVGEASGPARSLGLGDPDRHPTRILVGGRGAVLGRHGRWELPDF